jgi:hypothetical protein
VQWRAAGSGAAAASSTDFSGGTLPAGTLTFAPGEISKTVIVSVSGDATFEADESFTVQLASPSAGLVLGTAIATAIILNDDLPVVLGTAGDDALPYHPGQNVYEGLGGRDALDTGGVGFRAVDAAAQLLDVAEGLEGAQRGADFQPPSLP